jgi:hypothetical protein
MPACQESCRPNFTVSRQNPDVADVAAISRYWKRHERKDREDGQRSTQERFCPNPSAFAFPVAAGSLLYREDFGRSSDATACCWNKASPEKMTKEIAAGAGRR